MNFLAITPDGVGSTILVRIIAITLFLKNQNPLVTHELLHGGIVEKDGITVKDWDIGFSRSLSEIIQSVKDHGEKRAIIGRVSKHVLEERNDTADEKNRFYEFLNNFFDVKILCMRQNVFDLALSQSIREEVKERKALIFNKDDKFEVMNVDNINEDIFLKKLKSYVDRIKWGETFFPNALKINYEDVVTRTDGVIEKITGYDNIFEKNFDRDYFSLINGEYNAMKYAVGTTEQKPTPSMMKSIMEFRKLEKTLIDNGIITAGIPIKNTTLEDKQKMLKNFSDCYNIFLDFAKNHTWINKDIANYDFWNHKWLKI